MRCYFILFPALFLLPVQAETTSTTTFQVGAQVQSGCRVQANDLRFAALDEAGVERLNTSALLSVHCTRGTYVGMMLDQGQNAHPETGVRQLAGEEAQAVLGYRLQHQKAESAPAETDWENGLPMLVSDGKRQALTLYGELAEAPNGSRFLSDTLTITLVY
ncbi:MAG: spore coat protein U domain-containing protein [Saccharospirillum sp.]|uniref:spore coat protein U domain-containing protein n=1 Tax=Saccharospirillum sp. TaxID=2033801 RepID=UPI0032989DE5